MADNRMWLVHKISGKKILLAKYRVSSGWGVFHDDIHQKMGDLIKSDTDNSLESCIVNGGYDPYGDTSWEIKYEHSEDEEEEIKQQEQ